MKWTFADIWEVVADAVPDQEALVHGETRRTWAEYENRAARLAQVFTDHGLKPDAKVALFSYNNPEYLEAQFGIFKFRGVPINVTTVISRRSWFICSKIPTARRWSFRRSSRTA